MRFGVLGIFLFFCVDGLSFQTDKTQDSTKLWLNAVEKNKSLDLDTKSSLLDKAFRATLNSAPKDLFKISSAAFKSGDSSLFRSYNKRVINLSSQLDEGKSHAFAHWDLADFLKKSTPDSAFYHYQEAYTIFKTMNLDKTNNHYPARLLIAIGGLKDNIKDYVGAEKDYIAAIEDLEQVGRPDQLYHAYNALGITIKGMDKFNAALQYYNKAHSFISLLPADRRYNAYRSLENNIASVYLNRGDFTKAFVLFNDLEKNDDLLLRKPQLYAKVLTSKAITGFKSGLVDFKNFEKAIERANSVLDSINDIYSKARNYEYHAQASVNKGDTINAIQKALMAKTIAKETKNNDRLLSSLELLTAIDKKHAAQYALNHYDLTKKIQQKERTIQDKFARIRMETDDIIEENESLVRQKEIYAGIALGLLVFGIGIFTIVSQRIKNQKLKFKEKQQKNNQEIYNLLLSQHGKLEEGKKSEKKRISEELHDGILGQMLGIRLILSGLNDRTDEASIAQRAELIIKLQELEEEVRTISHELNASAYEKVHNFMLSIEDLINNLKKSTTISISFDYCKEYLWDSLDNEVKINVYRIIQEGLQNCIKHSKCKNALVTFESSKKMLNLRITDDGVGFEDTKTKKGIGLKNIISRVKKIKGLLKINSQPGEGTTILITFPNEMVIPEHPNSSIARRTVQVV